MDHCTLSSRDPQLTRRGSVFVLSDLNMLDIVVILPSPKSIVKPQLSSICKKNKFKVLKNEFEF